MKKALESPENKKCIKAINFDLETKRVKEIFHSNSPYIYLKAYQLVSKFLKSNDFGLNVNRFLKNIFNFLPLF